MSMRFNTPVFRPQDNKGRTLPGAQLFFFENYSTTPKTTYANVQLTNPNPHPIIADGAGKFTDIFLGIGDYRVILKDRKGQILWDRNDVSTNDLTEDVINDIERQLAEVLNLYRMQNLGEYGVADPDLEKTFTEPNAQYVVFNNQAYWTVSGTPLPYTTDSVTYPNPQDDPNLTLTPNVTFNYVDTGDQDRQKETTGSDQITLINGGDDLFPLIGQGIRVAGDGLWTVPSVAADGSPLPNPAILDSVPIDSNVTVNGGTAVNLEPVQITIASTESIGDRSFPLFAKVKAKSYYTNGEPLDGLNYVNIGPGTADGYGDHLDASGNVLKLVRRSKMSALLWGARANDTDYDDDQLNAFKDAVIADGFDPCFGGPSRTYRIASYIDWRDREYLTIKGNGCFIRIAPTMTPSYAFWMGSTDTGGSGTASLRKQQYISGVNFLGNGTDNLPLGATIWDNCFDCGIEKSVMSGFNGDNAEVVLYNSGFNFNMNDCEIGFAFQTDGNGNLYGFDKGIGVKILAEYLETSTVKLENTTIFGGKYHVYIPEQEKTTDGIIFKRCHFNRPYRYGVYAESNDGVTPGGALRITSMKFEDVHFEGYLSDRNTIDPRPILIRNTPLNNDNGKGIYGIDVNGLYLSGIQDGPNFIGCENGLTLRNIWYATTSLTYSTINFTGSSVTRYNIVELGNGSRATINGIYANIQEVDQIGSGDTIQIKRILSPAGNIVMRSGETEYDDQPLNRSVSLVPPKPILNEALSVGAAIEVDINEARGKFASIQCEFVLSGGAGESRIFVSPDGTPGNEIPVALLNSTDSRQYFNFDVALDPNFYIRLFGGSVTGDANFYISKIHYDGTNQEVTQVTG